MNSTLDLRGRGHVWLVGAGPGDPELITVRGLRCLRRAEVLLHDRLVSLELLDEAPGTALRIDVGKSPGHHAKKQKEICRLLIAHARAGRRVVRLKGGDPFVFGRGGEEALACAEAGVPFEIVPGISSAIAAPSAAGIPITHRGVAGSVAIVAGHCVPDSAEGADRMDRIDWDAVGRLDTIVILMGLGRLPEISAALIFAGRSPETPAAAIASATLSTQKTVVGTLANLGRLAAEAGLEAPATVVVGEVVRVGERIVEASYASEDGELAVARGNRKRRGGLPPPATVDQFPSQPRSFCSRIPTTAGEDAPSPAGVITELDLGAHGQPFTPLGGDRSFRFGLRQGSLPPQILRPHAELQQLGVLEPQVCLEMGGLTASCR